jgi:uncharacterized membrane protein
METITKSIDVNAPIRTVYDQWTQFEEFPKFMDGVKEVRQIDDTHLHWCAKIGGKELEWDAEIVEQEPDQCVSWHSTSGKTNNGEVRFDKNPDGTTRIEVTMEYDPEGLYENVGDALGVTSRRVQKDLKKFKSFIESRGTETGAWRGEVHGGQTTPSPRGNTRQGR